MPCSVTRAQSLLHLAGPEPAARMLHTMPGSPVGRYHGPHCLDDLMSDGTCHMGHHTHPRDISRVSQQTAADRWGWGDVIPRPGIGAVPETDDSSSTTDSSHLWRWCHGVVCPIGGVYPGLIVKAGGDYWAKMMHAPGGTPYSPLDLSWYDMLSWDTISETLCVGWSVPESVVPERCLPPPIHAHDGIHKPRTCTSIHSRGE